MDVVIMSCMQGLASQSGDSESCLWLHDINMRLYCIVAPNFSIPLTPISGHMRACNFMASLLGSSALYS